MFRLPGSAVLEKPDRPPLPGPGPTKARANAGTVVVSPAWDLNADDPLTDCTDSGTHWYESD